MGQNEIEIREYKPTDYIRIHRREFDAKIFAILPNPAVSAYNLSRGPAFTAISNGDIIACGGVVPFWKGVGEAWLITSDLTEKFKIFFAKTVHNKLEEIIKLMDFKRVQALIDSEHLIGQRFIERLGFKNETPEGMKKYIGGRTFYRYSLVKED